MMKSPMRMLSTVMTPLDSVPSSGPNQPSTMERTAGSPTAPMTRPLKVIATWMVEMNRVGFC